MFKLISHFFDSVTIFSRNFRDRIASYSIDYVASTPGYFATESTAESRMMKFTVVYDWLRTGKGLAVDYVANVPGNFATESSKYEAILSEKSSVVFTKNICIVFI